MATWDSRFALVLQRLHARMAEEERLRGQLSQEEIAARLDEWMLPVGEQAGLLLHLLAGVHKPMRVLELGGSVGYSTLWLASGVRPHGGRVFSVESNPGKIAQAREHLADAGLHSQVEWVQGEAPAILDTLDGHFDFVFLDVWKDAYLPCFKALQGRLAPGALLIADNMIRPQSEGARRYQKQLRADPRYESLEVPLDNGLELSRLL